MKWLKDKAKFIALGALIFNIASPATAAVAAQVRVSEYMVNTVGISDTNGEWIELQNTDSVSIDISGWVLGDNNDSFTFPTPTIIAGGSTLVICRGTSALAQVSCDIQNSAIVLNNTPATTNTITLKDASSTLIDSHGYTTPDVVAGQANVVAQDGSITQETTHVYTASGANNYGTPGSAPDVTAPAAPVHVSPTDGTFIKNGLNQTFDWTDVTDPSGVTYVIEFSVNPALDTDNSFLTGFSYNTGTSSEHIQSIGGANKTYYWHVNAIDGAGNESGWTDAWVFKNDGTTPTDPQRFAPLPGSHFAGDNTITINWPDVGSPNGASDTGSGVDGFSFSFTEGSSSLPDTIKDLDGTATSTTSSPLTSGEWWFNLRTVDAVGNWTSTQHIGPFLIDVDGPVITFNSPSDGDYEADNVTVSVEVTDANPIISVEARLVGPTTTPWTSLSSAGGDTYSRTYNSNFVLDGVYTLEVRATDSLNNQNTESISITIDNTRPEVAIDAPPLGAVVGGSVDIDATMSDTNLSEYRVIVQTSGGMNVFNSGWTATGGPSFSGTAATWDSSAEDDGLYLIIVRARDLSGNVRADFSFVEVDNTKPDLMMYTPSNGDYVSGYVSIIGEASDANLQDTRVVIKDSANNVVYNGGWISTSGATSTLIFDYWDSASVADGTYSIQIKARDEAGNVSTRKADVIVDNNKPTVVINSPATGSNLNGMVDVDADINDDNLVEYKVVIKDYSNTNVFNTGWLSSGGPSVSGILASWDSTTVSDGTYKIQVKARDAAGNTKTRRVFVTIDNTAPSVTVSSKTTTDPTPSLSGTVNDPTAAITVTVNGTSYGATNNGDGTWTLADNIISPALADGTYDVSVSATDSLGNTGFDATTNELTIDTSTSSGAGGDGPETVAPTSNTGTTNNNRTSVASANTSDETIESDTSSTNTDNGSVADQNTVGDDDCTFWECYWWVLLIPLGLYAYYRYNIKEKSIQRIK